MVGEKIHVIVQSISGEPFSASMPVSAAVLGVKTEIESAEGHTVGTQRILFESEVPLEDCQQLEPLFGGKERRLYLVIADNDAAVLFSLLQAFVSLREKPGWPDLREDMSIEEVQQLQLKGVTIVGGRITGLDLSIHDLSGTSVTTSGCPRTLICE